MEGRGVRPQITDLAGLAAAGLDGGQVAVRATEAYLLQILRHGFLHAGAPPSSPPSHLTPPSCLRMLARSSYPCRRLARGPRPGTLQHRWIPSSIGAGRWRLLLSRCGKGGRADPHPGNIAVGSSGQLIFYDFGESTLGTTLCWSCIDCITEHVPDVVEVQECLLMGRGESSDASHPVISLDGCRHDEQHCRQQG